MMPSGGRATGRFPKEILLASLGLFFWLELSSSRAQQPAVSVQRLQRTQPLPRLDTTFPTALVRRLVFAQDAAAGRTWLFAAGEDKLVYRWEVEGGAQGAAKLTSLEPIAWPIYRDIRGVIHALDVHRGQGRELVAIGGVGVKTPQVQVIDTAHPENQLTLLFNEGTKGQGILGQQRVYDLDFSDDGRLLAVGHEGDGRVLVWDLSKVIGQGEMNPAQAKAAAVDTGLRSVRRVKFNANRSRLALAGFNASGAWLVQVWSLQDGTPKKIQTSDTSTVECTGLGWIQDNSGTEQWVASFGKQLNGQIKGNLRDPVTALASNHQRKICIAAGGDGTGEIQCLLLTADGKVDLEFQSPPSMVVSTLALSPDGQFVAAAGPNLEKIGDQNVWSQQIRVWQTKGNSQPIARTPESGQVTSVGGPISKVAVISGTGGVEKIALAWGDHRQANEFQRTFSLLKRKQLETFGVADRQGLVEPAVVDAAGKTRQLLVDGKGRWFLATDAKGGADPWGPLPLLDKNPPRSAVLAGKRLAIGYVSGILVCELSSIQAIWNQVKGRSDAEIDSQGKELADRSVIRAFYGHAGRVTCLGFAAKGGWLASGSADGTITAWSMDGIDAQGKLGALGLPLELNQQRNLVVSAEPAPGTPAWEAGFHKGQAIREVRVGGQTVSPAQWQTALSRAVPGREIYVLAQATDSKGQVVSQDMLTRVTHEAMWIFYPQQDGNWWMATPQGLFDTSPGGLARLEFQLNANSQFTINKPYVEASPWVRPAREFVELLSGKAAKETLDQVVRERRPEKPLDLVLPPQLDLKLISMNPPRARFTARAVDEEIREVSVWVNSRRLSSNSQGQVETNIDPQYLREKDNILTGVALLKARGGTDVARSTVVRLPDHSISTSTPRKLHFLGVGVTRFQKDDINAVLKRTNPQSRGLEELEYADQDVRGVGEALQESLNAPGWERPPAGTPRLTVGFFRALTAESESDLAPTESNIRRQFQELSGVAQPGDFAVVMFAGHGVGGQASQPFQFVAQDTKTLFDGQGIDDRRFEALLGSLPCRSLVLLDSCHSGEEKSRQQLRNWPGLSLGPMVLSACRSEESSLEHPRYSHGLFSACALEALTGERAKIATGAAPPALPKWDMDGDGWVTVAEFCDYVSTRTPRLCDEIAGSQHHPTLLRSLTFQDADKFPLLPANPLPK